MSTVNCPLSIGHLDVSKIIGYKGTESVQDRIDLVRGVPKPCILIKTLGAGRIPPGEGLQFIAENAKPNDLVFLGFGTEDEVSESVALAEKFF